VPAGILRSTVKTWSPPYRSIFRIVASMLDCILSHVYATGKRRFKVVKFSKSMIGVAEFDRYWEYST